MPDDPENFYANLSAGMAKQLHATLVGDNKVKLYGFNGRQSEFTLPERFDSTTSTRYSANRVMSKMFFVQKRLYLLNIKRPDLDPNLPEVRTFFNSFKLNAPIGDASPATPSTSPAVAVGSAANPSIPEPQSASPTPTPADAEGKAPLASDDPAVAALVKSLDDPSVFVRRKALTELGKLRDGRAAEPVAKRLVEMSDRSSASATLLAIGPSAEDAVQKYLQHQDEFVRWEAATILEKIGTQKSLAPLREAQSKESKASMKAILQRSVDALTARLK